MLPRRVLVIEIALHLSLCGLVLSPTACGSEAAAPSADASPDSIAIDSGGRDVAAQTDGAGKPDGVNSDGGPAGEVIAAGPAAQCRQIVATLCHRAATTCADPIDPIDEAKCNRLSPIALGCDRAVASLAMCLADVLAQPCPAGDPLTLPDSCIDPLQIPPSVPQTKCRTVLHTVCEHDIRCKLTTETADACAADLEATNTDCSLAIGVGATYDRCLAELATIACPAAGGPTDPASCAGVVMLAK